MDCKTARLLLTFARPPARELGPEEAGALEGHLDRCPDCHGLADAERRLDERLGHAMNQVEVPANLRDELLARLESERGDWHRRRFARAMRLTAAAAAVLLLGWAGWHWATRGEKPIDPEVVVEFVNADATEDPRTRTEEALRRMGVETALPHLNYNLLACPPSLAELPGYPNRKVPMLLFQQNHHRARVYLVRTKALPPDVAHVIGGATYKLEIIRPAEGPYSFLVVHDGDDLDWLSPPEPTAA
jgi:hypothetical protein